MALTKFNYNSFDLTTAASKGLAFNSSANGFETAAEGSMTLIKTLTASSDSTLSFVNGSSDVVLDSTYPIYKFEFINIHPASDQANFKINFRDGGTAYDATKTTTLFETLHYETGSGGTLRYEANNLDLAQSTSSQTISSFLSNDNDSSTNGTVYLYSPSSTTFVKHFMSIFQSNSSGGGANSINQYGAGYCNVTAAIDGVQFSMSSGNIDSGTIKLYGIKDS